MLIITKKKMRESSMEISKGTIVHFNEEEVDYMHITFYHFQLISSKSSYSGQYRFVGWPCKRPAL